MINCYCSDVPKNYLDNLADQPKAMQHISELILHEGLGIARPVLQIPHQNRSKFPPAVLPPLIVGISSSGQLRHVAPNSAMLKQLLWARELRKELISIFLLS